MKQALDPLDRAYQVGDTDRVLLKSENHPELLEVEVVELDGSRPVFKVVSPGEKFDKILHIWDVVFV